MTGWLIALSAATVVWLVVRHLLGRRNRAGIATTVTARSTKVGGLVTRSTVRKAALRMRQLVSSRQRRAALQEAYHLKSSAEVAELMGSMKGVFMKLGQIASFAKESLPEAARASLARLQRDAPPMAFSLARQVIEEELGAPLEARLSYIDEVPVAAASIGQVHRAVTKDGREVALKVQYPGVDEAIRSDLRFGKGLAAIIQTFHKNADAKAMVAELTARLGDELDYTKEAVHQMRFHGIWAGHPLIRIPRVFPELSGRRVLCQEFVHGLAFADFLDIASADEKRLAVHVLNDFVFDSMHLHRVFNGDPHPGNYLFHEDGGVTFLDFGCVKQFERTFLDDVRGLNQAIVSADHALFERCVRGLQIILPGRTYDHDFLWSFFGYHAAPFAADREFAFTADYLAQAGEVMRPGNLRRLNLPPDLIFFNRITFGLNAIFARLGASENFNHLYQRYLDPEADHPPALARLGVSLPERFLRATLR